jgi:FixJ family two-component response regulator
MGAVDATVFIVDDDFEVLKALSRVLRSAGLRTGTFSSPDDFLRQYDPAAPGCLLLDVSMPGVDGLELQTRLVDAGRPLPIVFLTGRGDVPTSVRAMRAGALNFLSKPVREDELLDAVREAMERDRVARCAQAENAAERERLVTLTAREREVLAHVCAGRLNKQIADDLGVVEKTIKVHRAHVMEKMGVRSLADLVRVAERLGVARHGEPR